jgi:ABC-2 type transport system ATP-binding protein
MAGQEVTAAQDPVLSVTELTAGYGRRVVLDRLSLAIPRGQWLGLLGPNGAGKTTLLSCIAGMIEPVRGEILICGRSLRQDARAAKQLLGFACSPESIPGVLTGLECLQIFAAAKDLSVIDEDVLSLAASLEMTQRLPHLVDHYSLGMRQKLAVLLALVGEPQLLVLDESFNGLDPASALVLKKHLRARVEARRCSVLLATHSLDLVERYADRATLLLEGTLLCEWQSAQISRLRMTEGGLEEAVAQASRRHNAVLPGAPASPMAGP